MADHQDLDVREPLPRQTGPPTYTAAQRRRLYTPAADACLRAADPLTTAALDALAAAPASPSPAPASAGAVVSLALCPGGPDVQRS